MKGLSLKTFRLDLHKITPDSEKPSETIAHWKKKLGPARRKIARWYGRNFNFLTDYHELPLAMLSGFSFDELCKLRHSSSIMMHQTVTKWFETNAQHEIVRKIDSSMWRWGYGKATWNEIVDAYDHIRRFVLVDDPDFEVRLDHSTSYNEYGYSKYARIYLDGAFGLLVYYRQKHVLTIGFSLMSGRRLLIQQVQSAQRSGNRGLYKLPSNRVEFVINVFRRNFPGYALYLIDGNSLIDKTLRDYRNGLERIKESRRQFASWEDSGSYLKKLEEEEIEYGRRIAHLEADRHRLTAFYDDVGGYQIEGKALVVNCMLHHEIADTRQTSDIEEREYVGQGL